MLPYRLKKGDVIGVISPSDPIREKDLEEINEAILLMEKAGFEIEFSKYALSNELGYGATAKQKAEDINEMFKKPNIKAIFCARGGGNSNSVFEYLDYDLIKQNPKILCGFSDSTSLTNMIYEKTGLITFSGATFKSLIGWGSDYSYKEVIKRFVDASLELGDKDDEYKTIKEGKAEGVLIGGNLSLLSNMVCGKYKMNFKDKIIFIEDLSVEAPPCMVSNCLYYMKQNGVFEQIKGIWIGNYSSDISLEKILLDTIDGEYNFPIIKSENFGHIDRKTVIPIGTKAIIDTTKDKKIELVEECVL